MWGPGPGESSPDGHWQPQTRQPDAQTQNLCGPQQVARGEKKEGMKTLAKGPSVWLSVFSAYQGGKCFTNRECYRHSCRNMNMYDFEDEDSVGQDVPQ